jgi:hypothetical protein
MWRESPNRQLVAYAHRSGLSMRPSVTGPTPGVRSPKLWETELKSPNRVGLASTSRHGATGRLVCIVQKASALCEPLDGRLTRQLPRDFGANYLAHQDDRRIDHVCPESSLLVARCHLTN